MILPHAFRIHTLKHTRTNSNHSVEFVCFFFEMLILQPNRFPSKESSKIRTVVRCMRNIISYTNWVPDFPLPLRSSHCLRVRRKWNELSSAWAAEILFGFPLSLFVIKYNVLCVCVSQRMQEPFLYVMLLAVQCFSFGQWTEQRLSNIHYSIYCSYCIRFGIGIIVLFLSAATIARIHPPNLSYVSRQHSMNWQ